MKAIIKSISESFMQEALSSPRMLEDLAAMEKYMSESYDGRTFVELLQNADDAGASRIKVFSINGALVVANDGRPFNENDIMAICRSGASSKQRGSNIGYRGVGFKSATTISTEIVIYSAGAYFTFSKSVCAQALHKSEDKVPTVRIPFSYKESDLDEKLVEAIEVETGEGFTTFFIFLDGKIKKFIQELDGFNAGWLLFLKNVISVNINCGGKNYNVKITRKTISETDYQIKVVGTKEQWYIVSQNGVSYAFKYDNDTGIIPCGSEEAVFHCFLPTIDKTGFPFKVNADFSTDPSRKHIIPDESTKRALGDLQRLFSEFICRIMSERNEKLYGALSLLNTHTTLNATISEYENGILNYLRNKNWVPLNNGLSVAPSDVIIYSKWMDTDEKNQLVQNARSIMANCVNAEVLAGIEKFDQLLMKLGAREFSISSMTDILADIDIEQRLPMSLIGKLFVYGNRTQVTNDEWMGRIFVPLNSGFVQLKNSSHEMELNSEFTTTIKEILNLKEVDALAERYPVFGCLKKKKNSVKSKLGSIGSSAGTMAKTTALAVNKWKTPIQNCMAVEVLNGNATKDVSRKCDEYNVLSTAKDGSTTYIAVKTVEALGDSFKLSEQEYAAAQRLGDAYKVYVFTTGTSEVEYSVIQNPVDSIHMEKVVKAWEWLCDNYGAENENAEVTSEIIDQKVLKNIDASYFNAAQRELLISFLKEENDLNDPTYRKMIEQINFVFDFHLGDAFFVINAEGVSADPAKRAAMQKILNVK